ncbi:TFIIB-type zinc ribbon-containing protein [Velocimicrobium porci]|uniref:TFIIB-type zinc ribbon-containing protein n=1 Tax=Velocimicrobium porci TaxID=2606634 RepID=UPI002E268C09
MSNTLVIQYKCPSCGADMTFDAKSGTLLCESCGNTLPVENYPVPDFEEFTEETTTSTFESESAKQYYCNNCGAVLITDGDTSATTCSFCGAPMILADRLTGELAPAKIIPFEITKEQAQEAFQKWCKKGRLTPKGFMNAERIKNITGIYVPFWLYDLNGQGEVKANCTKVYRREDSNYIYTDTHHYEVYRKVDLNYLKIPADASAKMNDEMMDKLEPFHYDNLKEFKVPYLAGYIAEKYNYTDKDLLPRVKQRVEEYVNDYIKSLINGYDTITYRHNWIDVKQRNAYYTLIPVWMICYDYKDSEHTFAMNGQTGKVVGKPPISKKKVCGWFFGVSSIVFLILELLLIIGGAL